MNYGEEIAFWYLRLNGFFPLVDFVVHGAKRPVNCDLDGLKTGDCDLVAIRPPNVSERIGGLPEDWDTRFLETIGLPISGHTCGMIAEVKTGDISPQELRESSFHATRVKAGLDRLGFVPGRLRTSALRGLLHGPSWHHQRFAVSKVIFTDHTFRDPIPCYQIGLRHALYFVRRRMKTYAEKLPDRMFFQSSLVQLLTTDLVNGLDDERCSCGMCALPNG